MGGVDHRLYLKVFVNYEVFMHNFSLILMLLLLIIFSSQHVMESNH